MASYSKQMIELAKLWLAANPDPNNPWLAPPAIPELRGNTNLERDWGAERARLAKKVAREGNGNPALVAALGKMDDLMAQRATVVADIQGLQVKATAVINATPIPGQSKADTDETMRVDLGRWAIAWARDGYNVFDLGADFAASMLLTDARDLDITSVRLPFRGLLMLVPDGFARGVEGGHYTKIHITEIPRSTIGELEIGNRVADELATLSTHDLRGALDQLNAKLANDAGATLITKARALDPNDTVFHIYASDGVHVLDTTIERRGLTWDAFDALPDDVQNDIDRTARHTLRQIVFGTLAYISAVDHAIELREVPHKGKRAQRAAAPEPSPRIHDVGRTIRIDPKLVRAARSGSREVALHLKHRWIVRGHYRNQPYGPRRSEVKRIWIMPFWKGPADGAELVHTYLIDKRETTDEQRDAGAEPRAQGEIP